MSSSAPGPTLLSVQAALSEFFGCQVQAQQQRSTGLIITKVTAIPDVAGFQSLKAERSRLAGLLQKHVGEVNHDGFFFYLTKQGDLVIASLTPRYEIAVNYLGVMVRGRGVRYDASTRPCPPPADKSRWVECVVAGGHTPRHETGVAYDYVPLFVPATFTPRHEICVAYDMTPRSDIVVCFE
ncbi:MAG: hypothetical protein L0Y72_05790 [Gemmataceae bacterium]|nr:hypothetical protein [Gemmataceae bacterium]MCI0738536.1 hypothetical protein [Gemmataceae bacterium]